jgi:hypothetical protein
MAPEGHYLGPVLNTGPRGWLFLPFRGSYDPETSFISCILYASRCART